MLKFCLATPLIAFLFALFALQARANILGEITAPTETSSSRIVLGTGAALTIGILAFGNSWEKRLTRDTAARKPLGRDGDKFGDDCGKLLLPNIAYSGTMLLDYLFTGDHEAGERGILMVKSTAYSGLATDLTKLLVNESRPNGSKYSFPSGHTTTAFAFASVVGAEHPWYYGLGAYGLAAFVAATRLDMNMHYLHDLTAGAAIGASYGLGLYAQARARAASDRVSLQILPTEDLRGAFFVLAGHFQSWR